MLPKHKMTQSTANEDVSQDITVNNEADIAMAILQSMTILPTKAQNVTYTSPQQITDRLRQAHSLSLLQTVQRGQHL